MTGLGFTPKIIHYKVLFININLVTFPQLSNFHLSNVTVQNHINRVDVLRLFSTDISNKT